MKRDLVVHVNNSIDTIDTIARSIDNSIVDIQLTVAI
jgi:hypothetical protein